MQNGASMLEEGFWIEAKVGDEHLRLFAEHNPQGVQASVHDVNRKQWISPSEAVSDIDEVKTKLGSMRSNISDEPLMSIFRYWYGR